MTVGFQASQCYGMQALLSLMPHCHVYMLLESGNVDAKVCDDQQRVLLSCVSLLSLVPLSVLWV